MREHPLAEEYRSAGWWRPESLVSRFHAVCADRGDHVAIVEGERRLSFHEMRTLVGRLAGHLVGLGVVPGDVVSWQLPNWWEATVVHHAALQAGAVPNPLNPIFRARELRFVLNEARPSVLVTPASFRGFDFQQLAAEMLAEVTSIRHVLTVRGDGGFERLLDEPAEPAGIASDPRDAALLLYTSGTTSDPKGVQHSHETLLYELESLREMHAISPEDRYLGGAPVAHIAGLVYGVLMPFALGTSTVFLERWQADRALDLIEAEGVTFQTGTPTFLQSLTAAADLERRDLSSFRLFSTGGANIPTEMIRDAAKRLGCVVKRAYGSTEVPTLTATRVDDPEDVRLETDGRAIGPAEMRIVGTDGRDVAPGEEGEIRARSPEVFLGYRNTELDAESFEADGWYRTGDLGRVDAEGFLRVTGRLKDIIIRGGENISAKELEDLLFEDPRISDVAVVGIPDELLGERACAFVVPAEGATLSLDDVTFYLRSREIATQKLPERLELREALPKTASGKTVKAKLRDELARDSRG
ncbi:MAG: AMP-binding protein [Actinomycetota bacterium]